MRSLRALLCSAFLAVSLLTASFVYADAIQPIAGAPVQTRQLASGVTTNTTTTALGNMPNGVKTFYGEVVCSSGACTQTQTIFGTDYTTAINGVSICVLTLSGTPRDQNKCQVPEAFPYVYIITSVTTGTAAAGAIYVNY